MKRKYLLWLSLALNGIGLMAAGYVIYRLGGWNFFRYRLEQRGVAAEYEHRKSLYEIMQSDTASIVFLGNSLTAYCDWAELLGNPKIKNRGIPGDRINGVLDRLEDIIRLEPDQLFLMIGINDLLFDDPVSVSNKYRKLVDRLQKEIPGCQLHLKSVLPVNNQVRNTFINNEDVQVVNEAIEQLARDRSIPFIDLRPLLCDPSGQLNAAYTEDGVHLNGPAYKIWAAEVEKYLR
ncbi:GDSL-type esterase/lipase family protein [Flavilitoribacter nigricans]|uniref:G-D-S-L family lipolytic protein n=1 Tax=Flavilitoribacter nigricans (strain ATCC 23147 / DSM 23189 / NBRC 102662 / NCIMB 1420 / SS-2) TaxID=1122177 RepID=A0A2D0NCX9_FLAN2|nr:GDSL-type esterase/lipase family protein [Flavilitoribacter nigricans]PHN06230.1 G-D-S-L family lipolytic protein [Flavilitoribacter nigricans DSM 23189 = NBRC 102662]